MYKELSLKQMTAYHWRDIEEFDQCDTIVLTGAVRTGKTEIGSKAFTIKDAMKMVYKTPEGYRTKGYNLFTIVSVSKSLAFLNIIEPNIFTLERKGYKECKTTRQFYKAKGNVYVHTSSPMGMLQVKDSKGNITRFLYLGADNKRAMNRVTGLTMRGWLLDEAPLLGGNEEDNIAFIERMYERTATFRVHPYGRPLHMMTTNPQTGDEGLFYQRYIRGGWNKGILVISFTLLDNPIFTQKDVEYYRKIFTKAQFLRKIMGRWVKDNESLVYPKMSKDRVIPHNQALNYDYKELAIGLDEGQRDARAFVLAGFRGNYDKITYIDEYYHKNNPNQEPKDVNEYVDDFLSKTLEWYQLFGVPIVCYVDSAALSLIVLLRKAVHKAKHPIIIKPVNKGVETRNDKQAILERIDFTNALLGSERVEYSDNCKQLINATLKCTKKDGKRVDDGKTNNVDILDASEYAVKHRLKIIHTKIMRGG